jgi:hypothetical protein
MKQSIVADDFQVFGECTGRPSGWRRLLADAVCRWTGHLLWRSLHNSGYRAPGDSLVHYTAHCRRCWKWGYVPGDYRS